MGQSWQVTGPDARDIGSPAEPVRSVTITLVGGAVDVLAHSSHDVVRYEVGEVAGPALHVGVERGAVAFSQVREPGAPLMDTVKSFLTTQRRAVRLSVWVPTGVALTINTVSADVFVSGSSGGVNVNTVSGAVRLAHLSGRVDVKTAGGAVDGSALSGDLVTKTVSGATTVQASPLRSARLGAVEGNVLLDLTSPSSLVTANTVSGDVTVRIPTGAGYDVTASSSSGHVVVDGRTLSGGADRDKGGHRSDGDRALAAKIRSISGNVVVLRDGAGTAPLADAGLGEVQDDRADASDARHRDVLGDFPEDRSGDPAGDAVRTGQGGTVESDGQAPPVPGVDGDRPGGDATRGSA